MMIDIDYFKRYNDTFGHPAGDDALRLVGDALRNSVRAEDLACRAAIAVINVVGAAQMDRALDGAMVDDHVMHVGAVVDIADDLARITQREHPLDTKDCVSSFAVDDARGTIDDGGGQGIRKVDFDRVISGLYHTKIIDGTSKKYRRNFSV